MFGEEIRHVRRPADTAAHSLSIDPVRPPTLECQTTRRTAASRRRCRVQDFCCLTCDKGTSKCAAAAFQRGTRKLVRGVQGDERPIQGRTREADRCARDRVCCKTHLVHCSFVSAHNERSVEKPTPLVHGQCCLPPNKTLADYLVHPLPPRALTKSTTSLERRRAFATAQHLSSSISITRDHPFRETRPDGSSTSLPTCAAQ